MLHMATCMLQLLKCLTVTNWKRVKDEEEFNTLICFIFLRLEETSKWNKHKECGIEQNFVHIMTLTKLN